MINEKYIKKAQDIIDDLKFSIKSADHDDTKDQIDDLKETIRTLYKFINNDPLSEDEKFTVDLYIFEK